MRKPRIVRHLFAPLGAYGAAGMFTELHMLALAASVMGLARALRRSCCLDREGLKRLTRRFAWGLTALELIKIVYNFINGYTWPDAWVPLSFCSLFLYALWMAGYGTGLVRRLGVAFLTYGTVTGGAAFLIFPTTSLMNYPVWHYLCLYSMLYHSAMVYFGLLYLRLGSERPGKGLYGCFAAFFGLFAALSIGLNSLLGANFMLLREPYNIPFAPLHALYRSTPAAYTAVAFAAYLLAPVAVTAAVTRMMNRCDGNFGRA